MNLEQLRIVNYYFVKLKNLLFLRDNCRIIKHKNNCFYCEIKNQLMKEDFQKIDENFLYSIDLINIINKSMNEYSKFIDNTLTPIFDDYNDIFR